MDSVIPEKNENAFLDWESERRWLNGVLWLLLPVFIVLALRLVSLVPGVEAPVIKAFPATAVVYPETLVERLIIMAVLLLYLAIPIVIRQGYFKRRVSRLSKEACVFVALVAAEELERGDPVTASLSMKKLLLALSDFLGQKFRLRLSSAAPSKYIFPSKYMQVTPETIPKRAVFRAIQASGDTKEFQERLRDLAIGLHGNEDAGYPTAHQFLVWLDRKAEPYRRISQSFLDKHPTLRTMLLKVAPVILPAVSAIVVALL